MKTISTLALAAMALTGCYFPRQIQVDMVSAQLVRIDTIYRYSENNTRQQLTWRDSENMEYISYASLQINYLLGTRMPVLRAR